MDWQVISTIAEVVGTSAVVISLVYLAFQVRGNSELLDRTVQANRTSNSQSVIENFNDWRAVLLQNENTDVWHRGVYDLNSLSQEERIKFNFLACSLIWSLWFMYQLQRNEGLMADVNARVWQDLFKLSGFREWLTDHLRFHSDDFGEFLIQVRDSVGDATLEVGEPSSLIPGRH